MWVDGVGYQGELRRDLTSEMTAMRKKMEKKWRKKENKNEGILIEFDSNGISRSYKIPRSKKIRQIDAGML